MKLDKEVWVLINMPCFGKTIAKGITKGISQARAFDISPTLIQGVDLVLS